jgi:ketosteroid isomerase-like protein
VSTSEAVGAHGDVASSTNRKVVGALLRELSRGHYDQAQLLVKPGARIWTLGRRDFIDAQTWFAGLARSFPDGLPFTEDGAVSEGRRIAVRCAARGTTASGREFHNLVHFLFEIDDERIAAAWEYGDTLHAEQVFRG